MKVLGLIVIASAVYAVVSLIILVTKALAIGSKSLNSTPNGSSVGGVIYGFTKGMIPWEKESVTKHPLTFVAGSMYHLAIAGGIVMLVAQLATWQVGALLVTVLRIILACGIIAGVGLMIKRASVPYLRAISSADDYISNSLVTLFLAAALAESLDAAFAVPFLVVSIVLFFYIPMGKIRHCAFFFVTKIFQGAFFGRRGVFPTETKRA